MSLGLSEIVLIVILLIAFFKPEKLGEYSKRLGEALQYVKHTNETVKEEIIDPMKELTNPIQTHADNVKNEVEEVIFEIKGDTFR